MKKLLIVLVALVASLSLTGCKKAKEYKLGMGVVAATSASKDQKDATKTIAQVDATVAAVVLDEEGKIVTCRLDAVQNKITVTAEGTVTVPATLKTKMELGDDYNMAKFGKDMDWNGDKVVKEWYEQAKAFEAHVVGMTAADVKAMPTKVVEGYGYVISADEALLAAGCTIQITDFKAAVAKACEDAQGTTFTTKEEFTLGVAATSFDDGSYSVKEVTNKDGSKETKGEILVYSDFAASVVIDGKIAASLNDAIQPKFAVKPAEEAVTVTGSFSATKRELKEDYNMAKFGATMDPNGDKVVKEWYLQSAEFSKFVVGMTGEEVAAMETKANNIGYQMSTNETLLAAGCTIQITAIKAVVAKSVANAR